MTLRAIVLGLLAVSATAATFSATSGTATINNIYGKSEGADFTLTGPSLTLTSGGATAFDYEVTQTLNTSFSIVLQLLIDDNGYQGGSATAGGVTYPSLAFPSSALKITTISPITLTAGNLTVMTSASLSGSLAACATFAVCNGLGGGTPPTFPFNVNVDPIFGFVTLTYANINPPFSNQYGLQKAVFTTFVPTAIPEPKTLTAGFGLLILFALKQRLTSRRSNAS